jgi:hypothetical protein
MTIFFSNIRYSVISLRKISYARLGGNARKFSSIINHPKGDSAATSTRIIDECLDIRKSVQELNDRVKGPLEKSSQKNTMLPFVFLLGNHSSGKSSFANYVCQRKIQTAGVAPTDDTFTIIAPGPADVDRDGQSFIGDPDFGFHGLRTFGPQLIHHTELKVRSNLGFNNFMIVDSPGMIDSPMVRDRQGNITRAVMDRGYDFESVCRWYAERADVILLFFDPDKPGTTGETLSILTNSLMGLDQKLLIILNKADQFRKIHDFARAYGSLCWNLSKVIHRKDLPQIYTMCLPPTFQARSSGDQSEEEGSLGRGLIDLEAIREDVVAKVLNAPYRRIDNEISRLSDSVAILQMHCQIVNDIRSRYVRFLWKTRGLNSLAFLSTLGCAAGMTMLNAPAQTIILSTALGAVATSGLYWWQTKTLEEYASSLITDSEMESTFKRIYARSLAEKDEFIASIWHRVKDHLNLALTAAEVQKLPSVTKSDIKHIERILENDIPNLRRKSSPPYHRD